MVFDATPGANKEAKIKELRAKIANAEKANDEESVLVLEAELKAVEAGKEFDKKAYLLSKKPPRKTKHKVLHEIQNLPTAKDDFWGWDGIHEHPQQNYEVTFAPILEQFGQENFENLVANKSRELKRKVRVLDLFGGAYFLSDLENVSEITGSRLKNIDELAIKNYGEHSWMKPHYRGMREEVEDLKANSKRNIIEGNLYSSSTWQRLREEQKQKGGYDLIVCRPQGPFGKSTNIKNIGSITDAGLAREEIVLTLLERTLDLLSPEKGILFTQIPSLDTDSETWVKFWKEFIVKKENEGFKFYFGDNMSMPNRTVFAIEKTR